MQTVAVLYTCKGLQYRAEFIAMDNDEAVRFDRKPTFGMTPTHSVVINAIMVAATTSIVQPLSWSTIGDG